MLGYQNNEVQNEQLDLNDSKVGTDLSGKSQSGEVEDMESDGVVINYSDLGHAGMVNSQKEKVQDQINEGLCLNDLNIYDPSFVRAENI